MGPLLKFCHFFVSSPASRQEYFLHSIFFLNDVFLIISTYICAFGSPLMCHSMILHFDLMQVSFQCAPSWNDHISGRFLWMFSLRRHSRTAHWRSRLQYSAQPWEQLHLMCCLQTWKLWTLQFKTEVSSQWTWVLGVSGLTGASREQPLWIWCNWTINENMLRIFLSQCVVTTWIWVLHFYLAWLHKVIHLRKSLLILFEWPVKRMQTPEVNWGTQLVFPLSQVQPLPDFTGLNSGIVTSAIITHMPV